MFGIRVAKAADAAETTIVIARLNARLQPMDRGERFEDPLEEALQAAGAGGVCGGGTMLAAAGGVEYCEIEIAIPGTGEADIESGLNAIAKALGAIGIPKGSLLITNAGAGAPREIPVGDLEGLSLVLNGVDLPDEVYETCDLDDLIANLEDHLGDEGKFYSDWTGPTHTALYFYGRSFETMRERIANFVAHEPICQLARIDQIA